MTTKNAGTRRRASAQVDPAPTSAIPASVPASMRRGSFLPLENECEYDALLEDLAARLKPLDILEFLLVKDTADAAWEQTRLKRLRDAQIAAKAVRAAREVLNEISPGDTARVTAKDLFRASRIDHLHEGWMFEKAEDTEHVGDLLTIAGTTEEAFFARSLTDDIDAHAKIDKMIQARVLTRKSAPGDLAALRALSDAHATDPDPGRGASDEGEASAPLH